MVVGEQHVQSVPYMAEIKMVIAVVVIHHAPGRAVVNHGKLGRIARAVSSVGIQIDEAKNAATQGTEGAVCTENSSVKVFVIPTDEEAAIAKDTYELAGK